MAFTQREVEVRTDLARVSAAIRQRKAQEAALVGSGDDVGLEIVRDELAMLEAAAQNLLKELSELELGHGTNRTQ